MVKIQSVGFLWKACVRRFRLKGQPLVAAAIFPLRTWIKFPALTDMFWLTGAIYLGSEKPLGMWALALWWQLPQVKKKKKYKKGINICIPVRDVAAINTRRVTRQ